MDRGTSTATATTSKESEKRPLQKKVGLTSENYNELIGRLISRKGVNGVAVTSGDGKMIYHNDGIPTDVLDVYIEVISSIEYLCTVAARENDRNSRWQYIRFETDEYEMMITIDPTHWVFLFAEPQENYNGEKEEENLKRLAEL